jgi:hypothetical protein
MTIFLQVSNYVVVEKRCNLNENLCFILDRTKKAKGMEFLYVLLINK